MSADHDNRPDPVSARIRAAEVRLWSAELMRPGIAGLFLHGAAGIGKSVLAADIADRISSEHPGIQVTTVTGALTIEQLATTLVADCPTLVLLDQFDPNLRGGTIADRGLAAVLVCLAEEITGRDDQRYQARVIITARQPVTLSPHIVVRQVGPLTRWGTDEFARSLPRLAQLTSAEREYAWRLTAGHPRSLLALDARLADVTFADLADGMARLITSRTGLLLAQVLPTELEPAVAAAITSAAESAISLPLVSASVRFDDKPKLPDRTGGDARRPRFTVPRVLSATLVTAAIACAPFAIRALVAGSVRAAAGVSPAASHVGRTALAGHTPQARPAAPAAQAPQAAAATWLAGNVTGGTLIGCDPAMCASLSHLGLARADLSPLRPASDLAADGLIVATPQARRLMGTGIQAAAPELAASFGTGSEQVRIWAVTPGGAAAYSSRLATDMASRREGGNQIMGNPSIKASGDNWIVLCSGRVDERILLALAEMAHSGPLTIASLGTASPGAAPQVPLRSVLIDVADPAAAAAYLKVQDQVMRPLAVRIGHASLWVEYGVPSPLGLFQAES